MVVDESGAKKLEPVAIPPDDVFQASYRDAMKAAGRYAKRCPGHADLFHDAATDALMWARDHYKPGTGKFEAFAARAVRTWLYRCAAKSIKREERRPQAEEVHEGIAETRTQAPTQPLLIEDLPEELGFLARLYTVDGFSLREIALLTSQGHNTVALKLKRAAMMLAEGRMKPERRPGERRLSKARPESRAPEKSG